MIILSSYSFKTYNQEQLTCEVFVRGTEVTFKNYISDPLWVPFGVKTSATYKDLMEFYEDRCFPRERANCKTVLKSIGLDYYDPELICRKTHGQQFDDFLWIQFSDEPQVEYKDIKLRD